MNITTELLQSLDANQKDIDLVASYDDKEAEAVIRQLVKDNRWDYANWLLPRLMDYKGYVSYAVFAAELVLPIWEKKHPDEQRPRQAIAAAKRCIDDPSEENKKAAELAAEAAWAAEWAAEVEAARAAVWERSMRAAAAYAATRAAAEAAAGATMAAARAAGSANTDIKPKIIEKGLELLKKYPNA